MCFNLKKRLFSLQHGRGDVGRSRGHDQVLQLDRVRAGRCQGPSLHRKSFELARIRGSTLFLTKSLIIHSSTISEITRTFLNDLQA